MEADSCTPCSAGHFAGATGLTQCEACPVGEFANVTGSDDCTLCPAGADIHLIISFLFSQSQKRFRVCNFKSERKFL